MPGIFEMHRFREQHRPRGTISMPDRRGIRHKHRPIALTDLVLGRYRETVPTPREKAKDWSARSCVIDLNVTEPR
jgi:hypothetical protein